MTIKLSHAAGFAAVILFAATGALWAQSTEEEHTEHHPETEATEAAPPVGEAPRAGMMGQDMRGSGMMQRPGGKGEPMQGMMSQGMKEPSMMHDMMERMMRGMAEGIARGIIEGMAAVHDMDADGMMGDGVASPSVSQHGMMLGQGVGPTMLYGMPTETTTVENVRNMLGGALAWHGNPRLKLGEVTEQNATAIVAEILTVDDSLVQRLAIDRATGAIHRIE